MIRTLWAALNALIATPLLSLSAVIGSWFNARPAYYDGVARNWSRWILWASGVRVRTEGLEDVALDQAQIFASNHASWYDVWAIAAALPKRFRFVAKKELG